MHRPLVHTLAILAFLTPVAIAAKPGLKATDLVPVPGEAALQVPEGLTFRPAADNKTDKIYSPTAFAFDEKGALFVAETYRFRFGVEDNRDRLYWYLDDIASQTTADRRALHEKWKAKVPIEKLTEKSEVILKLSDADAQGRFKKSEVFADGFNDVLDGTAGGVFAMEGTVYFASIPKVWALRDTKGTGKADQRDVIQDGFGVRVSFSGHDLNGFALGPDGRLYGTIGDRGFNLTTREGKTYPYPDRGCAFRFDPDGTNFEVIHTGLRNPKEIAFDDQGNAISVDNNSDQGDKARVVYIMEGGDSGWTMEHQALHSFHRQLGLENHPPNRWMVEKMSDPQNDAQPAYILPPVANLTSGPCGLAYHPGTGFLESEAGHFQICDYTASATSSGIWSFKVDPSGAGMKMTDSRQLVWGVTATDVDYSADGSLYVADFQGGWTSHDAGRIFSLDPGANKFNAAAAAETAKLIGEGFEQRSSDELAALLHHPDQRVRVRAELALSRKPDALEKFKAATTSENPLERLHGVWGIGIIERRGSAARPGPTPEFVQIPDVKVRTAASKVLLELITHADPEVRAQAVKALEDSPIDINSLPVGPLLVDPSLRVRSFAAITIGKLKGYGYLPQIWDMLIENADKDAYIRHAGAYAMQMLCKDPRQLMALSQHQSPHVRMAAVIALRRMKDALVGAFIRDADPKVSDEAIRAVHDEFLENARPAVAALLDDEGVEKRAPFMLRRLVFSAFRVGGSENARRLLKVAANPAFPLDLRHEALRLISVWPEPPVADQSTGRLSPLPKRDVNVIKPVLIEMIPTLLKLDDVLAPSLDLLSKFSLTIDRLDSDSLRAITEKASLDGSARASALELYAARKPADLAAVLGRLSEQPDDTLALAAMKLLVAHYPQDALKPLMTAAGTKSGARTQAAWKELAKYRNPEVATLIVAQIEALRANQGVAPAALELLAAARTRPEPEVKKALATYDAEIKASTDPLAPWMASLEGGDAQHGASLFMSAPAAECLRCHRAEVGGDLGGEVGPNLAGVASRGDRRYLLESLIVPSAKVVPGYGIVSMTFANGASLGGILQTETPDYIEIDASGKRWRVMRKDIKELTPAISAMPPMGLVLKPNDIRDLVAWLATLQKGEKPRKPLPPAPVLDPGTLK